MALIQCPECSTRISDKAASCPSCGCPIASQSQAVLSALPSSSPASMPSTPTTVKIAKSRGVYIILGLLFGWLGFHNFYSGHNLRGAIKIGVFIIAFGIDSSTRFYSGFSMVALVIFTLWALIEIVAVKNDAAGNIMS